jgi:hypothetical protein
MSDMPGMRAFEDELHRLAAKDGFCPDYEEARESCDCIVCRTRTLLTEWEDHPLFAASTPPLSDCQSTPELLGEEGTYTVRVFDFAHTYESATTEIHRLLHAANPGQSITVERHHIDKDGKWFTVTIRPYATGVQAPSTQPVSESPGNSGVEKVLESLAATLQGWARTNRREAERFPDREKAKTRARASGYDAAADLLLTADLPANLTQPVPGNSGGVEEEGERVSYSFEFEGQDGGGVLFEVLRETGVPGCPQGVLDLPLGDAELRELIDKATDAASTQPPSPPPEEKQEPIRVPPARFIREVLADRNGTGEQSPAEPQGEATKVDAPAAGSTSSPNSCPEPQGDVVELVAAIITEGEGWQGFAPEDIPRSAWEPNEGRARQIVAAIEPLLALDVKERLIDAHFLEKLRMAVEQNIHRPIPSQRDELANLIEARLDTPAPSEPEEEKS